MKTQAGDIIVLCKSDMAECAQITFFRPEDGQLKQLPYPGKSEYLSGWAKEESECKALFRDVARLVAQSQGLTIRSLSISKQYDCWVLKQLDYFHAGYISCREFVPS
jgi:hypothetical protein